MNWNAPDFMPVLIQYVWVISGMVYDLLLNSSSV